MPNETNEPASEKKGSQGSFKRGQLKRSKESHKTLSTITEEPKSLPTVSSKAEQFPSQFSPTNSEDLEAEEKEKIKHKTPLPLPQLPEPLPPRKKKHTSVVLKGAPPAIVVAHERPRTLSLQERLISHITVTGKPLFPTVLGDQSTSVPSILVSGFGLRNLTSLQEALQIEEHDRLKQLYRAQESQDQSSSSTLIGSTSGASVLSHPKTESTAETQTDIGTTERSADKLRYLMGLQNADEEEASRMELQVISIEEGEEEETGVTESMKQAQKYLRVHKIFEFFQFITAHLLSALPDNPIEFIIDLLDKCLVYRAGLTEPPLLYTRKHLECLFYLMDKMRTGYIELEQYKTGMHTVGICQYNEKPPLTTEGLVTKECFMEEAYDSLSHLLNDMIRRRWLRTHPPVVPPPPPSQISSTRTSSADEYPSALSFGKNRLFMDFI